LSQDYSTTGRQVQYVPQTRLWMTTWWQMRWLKMQDRKITTN